MSQPSKRFLIALALAAALGACTKKTSEPASPPAASQAAAAASAAELPKPEPLKAAWVYVGPVADAGSTMAHDRGRKAVEAELGRQVQTSFVEKVPEGAGTVGVIRDLAAKGNQIIFATSSGYIEPMLKVAAEFPNVKFENAFGRQTTENLRSYETRHFEVAYLAGVIAGRMTRTNALGFVASVPIPEVLRSINAFTLGAQSVNPKIRTKVVWVNDWFDPPKESAAAQSLMNGGADVLLQSTQSTAVLQAAEANGKRAFGWNGDMSAYAPRAHLASCVVDWGPYYKKAIRQAIDGTWATGRTSVGIKEGQLAIVKLADAIPADIKERVEKLSAGLKSGTFAVYTGPVVDGAGKERLAAGAVADQDWLDKMDFFVKGVEGKPPSAPRTNLPATASVSSK